MTPAELPVQADGQRPASEADEDHNLNCSRAKVSSPKQRPAPEADEDHNSSLRASTRIAEPSQCPGPNGRRGSQQPGRPATLRPSGQRPARGRRGSQLLPAGGDRLGHPDAASGLPRRRGSQRVKEEQHGALMRQRPASEAGEDHNYPYILPYRQARLRSVRPPRPPRSQHPNVGVSTAAGVAASSPRGWRGSQHRAAAGAIRLLRQQRPAQKPARITTCLSW